MQSSSGRSRVQGVWNPSKPPEQPKLNPCLSGGAAPNAARVQYQEEHDKVRHKPEVKVIRLLFFPSYLTREEADSTFARLMEEIPWEQNTDELGVQPRLTKWYGKYPYEYSKLMHPADNEWHPVLLNLKEQLEQTTGHAFNSVLCNLYRNGRDSVDWHSDDEPGLRDNPYIASISLGELRSFEMRQKPKEGEDKKDFTYSQHVKMALPHGSLVVMSGSTQECWQHRIPKEYHDKDPRINLTFRTIFSVES